MTRLVTCGWETGDITELAGTSTVEVTTGSTSASTVATATTAPTPASGNYCLKFGITTVGRSHTTRSFGLGGNQTDIWLRFRLFNGLSAGDNTNANGHRLVRFIDSAGALVAMLILDASTGVLRAYRGGGVTIGSTTLLTGSTLLGSASTPISASWNLVEIHLVPTTGATGTFEIWLNGTQVLNLTSIQTSAGLANVNSITIGVERFTIFASGTAAYIGYDDLAVNNTAGSVNNGRCGDYRIGWFPASGAGASTQWTPTSGSNYAAVDDTGDLSAGTADYVAAGTTALVDDYTVTNLPSGASAIPVVIAMAYAINPDAGTSQVKVGVISGSTTSAGSAQSPGASWAYVREQFETDPDTTAAWTVSGVNAAKVRIESV